MADNEKNEGDSEDALNLFTEASAEIIYDLGVDVVFPNATDEDRSAIRQGAVLGIKKVLLKRKLIA